MHDSPGSPPWHRSSMQSQIQPVLEHLSQYGSCSKSPSSSSSQPLISCTLPSYSPIPFGDRVSTSMVRDLLNLTRWAPDKVFVFIRKAIQKWFLVPTKWAGLKLSLYSLQRFPQSSVLALQTVTVIVQHLDRKSV